MSLALALGLVGCGGDGGDTDAGSDSGAEVDAGGGADCAGQADGTSCGSGLICLAESCVTSACGDGFVDEAGGEECEDGNDVAFDGCEPGTCTFTCVDDAACDDGFACNGVEACEDHVCAPGELPGDGTACEQPDGSAGLCRGTECVGAGCGNGVTDGGEDCDDMNMISGDGCENDCTYSCDSPMDPRCDDGSVCTGVETCDLATHACMPGTILDCDDGSACTADSCDPVMGCSNDLIDMDMDGFADVALGACGTDCDDTNDQVYPGATELCEPPGMTPIDNDCDPATPNPSASFWFLDCDEDGYSVPGAVMQERCEMPAPTGGCGWTQRIPNPGDLASVDCNDTRDDMYPGNTTMYPVAPATSGGSHPTLSCPSGLSCTNNDTRYGGHDCDNAYGDTNGSSFFPPGLDSDGQAEWTDFSTYQSPTNVTSNSCSIAVTYNTFLRSYQASCSGNRGWTASNPPSCGGTGSYTYCGVERAYSSGFIIAGSPIQTPTECTTGSLCSLLYTLTCVGSPTDCSRPRTCTPGSRGCIWHYYRCARTTETRPMRCR